MVDIPPVSSGQSPQGQPSEPPPNIAQHLNQIHTLFEKLSKAVGKAKKEVAQEIQKDMSQALNLLNEAKEKDPSLNKDAVIHQAINQAKGLCNQDPSNINPHQIEGISQDLQAAFSHMK